MLWGNKQKIIAVVVHVFLEYSFCMVSNKNTTTTMQQRFSKQFVPTFLACVASVSVLFQSKERPTKGIFGFGHARNETRTIFEVFDSHSLFFALKPHRNACYTGYNIPSLISSLICIHLIIYLVFTVTLWLCFPSAESTYDPPRRTNFASFPLSLNSSDTHSHAFPNMSYIPNNKIQFKHS